MRRLRVLTTQEEIVPDRLPGSTAVVIDVMLATTTLVTIIENGARRVFPVGTLRDAERLCATLDPASLVRGGEQDALPIDGYECGPFPHEFHRGAVHDRDVVFVSTNGTRAIAGSAGASRVLVASLRNAPAVARYLAAAEPDSLYIVCAGSMGRFALEDFACAGVLLRELGADDWRMNDGAWLALETAERYSGREDELLRTSRAGRWFLEHGQEEKLDFVASIGASDVVAEMRDGQLVRAEGTHSEAV